MKKNLERILDILISGSPAEYRVAKKEIEKIFHAERKLFHKNADVIFEYLDKFDQIKNVKNQEAFISGISLFFLVLADNYFNKLADFVLKTIQNSDGHVREATRKASDWLAISLSARMHPYIFTKRKINLRELKEQSKARNEFNDYLAKIEKLLEKYSYLDTEDTIYVDQMKPSVYKSLELLWGRVSDLLKYSATSSPEILTKRKEIETKLTKLLKKSGKELDFWDITSLIWEEQDHRDFGNLIEQFGTVNSLEELNHTMQLLNDAWNYFPHKSLRGKCPVEMRLEALN